MKFMKMTKENNYIKLLAGTYLLLIFSLFLFAGCSNDDLAEIDKNQDYATLHFSLDIPGMNPGLRSMSHSQESYIDYDNLHVLVFEKLDENNVLFRYQATITGKTPPQISMRVPISKAQEKYVFVIVANTSAPTISVGTPKEEALNQFFFDCKGKWKTDGSSPIPMWGEYGHIVIKSDQSISVLMHRALARVDIGTLFKFNNPEPGTGLEYTNKDTDKESVWGLDNFKIKDIHIFRTLDKAYVTSSSDKIVSGEVVEPNIPASAKYNSDSGAAYDNLSDADSHPLIYTLPAGSDSYIREIYIPESMLNAQSSAKNVPCIVIGGYYGEGNTSHITYYRADFATYDDNGKVLNFQPILRNHRYTFDIQSVNGPGFEDPELALNSNTSNMVLKVEKWNEVALNFYVQGEYFFSLDTRKISLEAHAEEGSTEISRTISYKTNLETTGFPFTYEWESSGSTESEHFDVTFNYAEKTITFKAKQENVNAGATPRSDILILKIENFQFTITVDQKANNANYTMDCSDIVVRGIYREGIALDYTNYISMKITSESSLNNLNYELRTIQKNGIYFATEGTFDSDGTYENDKYEYVLELAGYGTLVNESGGENLRPFDVTITSNSLNTNTCSAKIISGYSHKKILAIGANAAYRHGYALEPNSASRALLDANINFGTDPNSTVVMNDHNGNSFIIEYMTSGKGLDGEKIDYNYLSEKLKTFKPDIILTGQAIDYFSPSSSNPTVIYLLANFVENGGVFLMFNEYFPTPNSVNEMVKAIVGSPIAGSGRNHEVTNMVLSLPSGDEYENDPILNGPFGDLRGKNWGLDGVSLHGFTNINTDQVVVYSKRDDDAVCMFRHKTKPFFFIGDGGFLSNNQRYLGGYYTGSFMYHPFTIDTSYRPIPRMNYTLGPNAVVYNSSLFANIIAWAVDYLERN